MRGLRIRTVATQATSLTHAWPRWSALVVWALACAVFTAALVVLQRWVLRDHPDPRWIELYHFGPALAVGVLWLVFRDHHQRPEPELGRRLTVRAAALAILATLTGAVVVVTTMAARDTLTGSRTDLPPLELPLAIAVASAIVTALGEETAWRAFLQPELERWWGPLPSAIGVGIVWALWSALVRHPGAVGAVTFGLVAIALSVAIAALIRMAGGHHLLLATLCHAAVNVGLLVVLPGHGDERLTGWALVTASVVVGAVLWLVSCFRPTRPDPDDDAELDDDTDAEDDGDGPEEPEDDSWGLSW